MAIFVLELKICCFIQESMDVAVIGITGIDGCADKSFPRPYAHASLDSNDADAALRLLCGMGNKIGLAQFPYSQHQTTVLYRTSKTLPLSSQYCACRWLIF